jgi:hypothetical protein
LPFPLTTSAKEGDSESPVKRLLTPESVVKYEHTLVQFTTQQLVLLAMRIDLTGRDSRFDWYGDDQGVGARIKITITLSW